MTLVKKEIEAIIEFEEISPKIYIDRINKLIKTPELWFAFEYQPENITIMLSNFSGKFLTEESYHKISEKSKEFMHMISIEKGLCDLDNNPHSIDLLIYSGLSKVKIVKKSKISKFV